MTSPRQMRIPEVSRLLKRVLKEAFPSVSFKLTPFNNAGSVSIEVAWTDGPRECDVDRLIRIFESKRGTTGSVYYVDHIFEGEDVRFLVDYVYATRGLTVDFLAHAKQTLEALNSDPAKFQAFLDSIHYKGVVERDAKYLERMFARTLGSPEPRASVTATALLMANPFLHEQP